MLPIRTPVLARARHCAVPRPLPLPTADSTLLHPSPAVSSTAAPTAGPSTHMRAMQITGYPLPLLTRRRTPAIFPPSCAMLARQSSPEPLPEWRRPPFHNSSQGEVRPPFPSDRIYHRQPSQCPPNPLLSHHLRSGPAPAASAAQAAQAAPAFPVGITGPRPVGLAI